MVELVTNSKQSQPEIRLTINSEVLKLNQDQVIALIAILQKESFSEALSASLFGEVR